VHFLDSDDILFPNAIEAALDFFEDTDVVKVHWPLINIDASGTSTGKISPNLLLSEGNLLAELVSSGPGGEGGFKHCPPTTGNLWSRKYLTKVFPIPELVYKTNADHYLLVLAAAFGELRKISVPMALYRIHGSNITSKPIEEYSMLYFNYFEHSCEALSKVLSQKGIDVKQDHWPRDTWLHKIYYSIQEITGFVANTRSFVLVDDNHLQTSEIIFGRKRIPFLEKFGRYWGQPLDDKSAIREIERQRLVGAQYIFFAWVSFWYLDYYQEMHTYLKSNYECILDNDRLLGFRLRK